MNLADAERLFHEALILPTAQDRSAFLRGACGENRALHDQVERLLKAHEANASLLPTEPGNRVSADPVTEGPGLVIGRYKLLEQIGEGGMGVVYMAGQTEPVIRKVALKIIKLGMDSKSVVARFEAERQALAMMDHPNIARVFDGGTTVLGRPYFVMELIKGLPITDYCDRHRLSPRARLELFMQVCHGVQHAHQKGIIHRDLKPTNILVAVHDDKPVPKIIDFGVAKATQQPLTERTVFTRFQQLVGTPSYMSPEQAGMSSLDVDTRSDIYSLGVLLYELLTGRTPFTKEALLEAGFEEMCRVIREKEPPKPSTRLSTLTAEELEIVALRRQLAPDKLGRLVRGELDWIVLKALEKDRSRRYETATGLARDIGRYLNQEPVSAVAPTFRYQALKFARRNRVALATALAFLGVLLTATVVSAWQAMLATKARNMEFRASQKLRVQVTETEKARESALQAAEEAARQEGVARRKAAESNERLVRQILDKGVMWLNHGDYFRALLLFTEALRLDQGDPASQRLQRVRIAAVLGQCPRLRLVLKTEPLREVVFSPDHRWIVGRTEAGKLRVWDAISGESLSNALKIDAPVSRLGVTGRRLWVATRAAAGVRRINDPGGGEPPSHVANLLALAFKPRIYDPLSGEPLSPPLVEATVQEDSLDYVETPTGQRLLAIRFDDNTADVWDVVGRNAVMQAKECGDYLESIVLSAEGGHIAAISEMAHVPPRIWSLRETKGRHPDRGELRSGRMLGHAGASGACFSPDGTRVATMGADGTVRIWESASGRRVGQTLRPEGLVTHLSFAPDGEQLATATEDGVVQLWLPDGSGRWSGPPLRGPAQVSRLAFSPSGQSLLVYGGSVLRVWDLHRMEALPERSGPAEARIDPPDPGTESESRTELDVQSVTVRIRERTSGKPLTPPLPHEAEVTEAACNAGGRLVATVSATPATAPASEVTSSSRTLRVWDAQTGDPLTPPWRINDQVGWVAFGSGDQSVEATTLREDTLRWRLDPQPWPLDDLRALVELLGANRLDETGTPTPLGEDELESSWRALRSRYPGEFAVSLAAQASTEREATEFARRMGRWPEVAAGFKRRQVEEPSNPAHALQTAGALARMGAWDEAEEQFRRALLLGSPPIEVLPLLACLRLARGDGPGYRAFCQQLLETASPSSSGAPARVAAWVVGLGTNSVETTARALRLAEHGWGTNPEDPMTLVTQGALLYRAGQNAKARERLRAAASSNQPVVRLFALLYLSMVEAQAGDAPRARRHLNSARTDWEDLLLTMDAGLGGIQMMPWTIRLEFGTLLAEAGIKVPPPPPEKDAANSIEP